MDKNSETVAVVDTENVETDAVAHAVATETATGTDSVVDTENVETDAVAHAVATETATGTDSVVDTENVETDAVEASTEAKQPKKKRKGLGRTRNFATVVYPESAPSDWQERLSELHIEALISPLHDCDVNPDGSPKKPHWHVMVMFPSVKEFDTQVKPIFDAIGGVGRENVGSVRGYARYLCHLDNPEKHQYSPSDVIQMGGADYASLIVLASGDGKAVMEITQFVRANGIRSYANLLEILAQVNMEWFNLLIERKTYVIVQFMKAMSWERESGYSPREVMTDPKTGEARIIVRKMITDPKSDEVKTLLVDPKTGEVIGFDD